MDVYLLAWRCIPWYAGTTASQPVVLPHWPSTQACVQGFPGRVGNRGSPPSACGPAWYKSYRPPVPWKPTTGWREMSLGWRGTSSPPTWRYPPHARAHENLRPILSRWIPRAVSIPTAPPAVRKVGDPPPGILVGPSATTTASKQTAHRITRSSMSLARHVCVQARHSPCHCA